LNYADGLETEDEEEEEEDFEIVPEERILQRRAEQREQVNGQGNGVNGHHSNGESSETIHFQNILSESDNPEENYNNSEDEDMDGQVNIWTFD
jgi:hypothetical protein